jgi:hypothetical protein
LNGLPQSAASQSGNGGSAGSVTGGRGGQSGGSGGAGSTGGSGGAAGAVDSGVDDADTDSGEATFCGDGLVNGMELCDTAIAADEPGACPSECSPLSQCVTRALNGTGCRAECVVLQAQCSDGDDCCPGNCTPSNDDDCSASCGDGVVQEDEMETCEPEPSGDAGDALRCDEDCDDGDACTMDVLSGSAMNCNVACARVEITALIDGDNCCPDGASMLTDADCMPVCGNDVRERGEDCDDNAGCNEVCDLGFSADQRRCLDTFAVTNDRCALCECTSCTAPKLSCFEDSEQDRRALCIDLQACVRESNCFDSECYCGSSASCFPAAGPCIPEVEAAAETTNALELDSRKMNTMYAIGRSYELDVCIMANCASACE